LNKMRSLLMEEWGPNLGLNPFYSRAEGRFSSVFFMGVTPNETGK